MAGTIFTAKQFSIAGIKEEIVCKFIKPKLIRFHNRSRIKGWFTASANHLLQTHINFVNNIAKILPVEQVYVEHRKFDIQKLENPEIKDVDYQTGRMKGYTNAKEYVLCRDKHTCQLCEKNNVFLHIHHVIWRQNGGQDTPENLITLCNGCHTKVHENSAIDKKVAKIS